MKKTHVIIICISFCFFSIVSNAAPTPSDFNKVDSANGVILWKYTFPGGYPDYILEIDLTKAKIKSTFKTPVPHPDQRSDHFTKLTLSDHWEKAKTNNQTPFAIFDFAFSSVTSPKGTITLPLRVGDAFTVHGYGLDDAFHAECPAQFKDHQGGECPNNYRVLHYKNDLATTKKYYPLDGNLSYWDEWLSNETLEDDDEIIGGYSSNMCKGGCSAVTARVFMGPSDSGKKLFIFSSEMADIPYAVDTLKNFGVNEEKILQGDGGGSGQLIVRDSANSVYYEESTGSLVAVKSGMMLVHGRKTSNHAYGPRRVPHAIAILYTPNLFWDIDKDAWFTKYVLKLSEHGIVNGYPDGSFKPSQFINRVEFLKMALKAAFNTKFYKPSTDPFPDVDKDAWFAPYVAFAKDKNIVGGYPDGQFKPANYLNRAEAVKILVTCGEYSTNEKLKNVWNKYKQLKQLHLPISKEFSDVTYNNNIEWFYYHLYAANQSGLVSGYDDGTFKPANSINRAEASKIIALGNFED
ncbi:MAG: S-layer homology domain-containing protein [Pseudomonadota bacterium]